jgi:hypothetical protein
MVNIELMSGLDELNAGAKLLRLAHLGARPDTEGFGFITGGNGTGGIRHERNDGDGAATEFGSKFLFDGGEIRVQVEKQPADTWFGA